MLKGLGLRGKEERLAAAAVVGKALGLTFVTGRFAAPTIKACNEPVPPGVAIISSGEGAISTNARHSAAALDQLGIAHRLISVSIWKGDSETRKGRLSEASAEVILLHVQPDDAVELIVRLPPKAVGSRLIGFFMWETESLPAAHQLGAMLVDEIWTGSHYSAKAFQTSAPSVAAHVVGHAVQDMPPAIDFDARQWAGVSRDTFLFYTHFDARSWITRKNPVGAVRAFCRAFPSSASAAALLIKVRIPEHWADPEQEPWWKELYEEASRDSRIRVISADLDPGQMSALALAADAFVSLHRSEGFGYAVAEAMLAGKPVVVTDYSGSQDFAGQAEALLVPARRRPVRFGEFLYGDPGQVWSEPDIEAAALAMRALSEDRAIGADLARNGQTRIREQCSIERLSLRYAERLGCGSS
jgi:glycosyltransferase involved in cell wall biosynthesis